MRRLNKIVILLITLFIVVPVFANTDCNNNISAGTGDKRNTGYKININNSNTYDVEAFALGGKTAYCIHASRPSGLETGRNNYTCIRKIYDPTGNSSTQQQYDAGLLAIINAGYHKIQPASSMSAADNELYIQTNLAVRVYDMLWGTSIYGSLNESIDRAYKNYANQAIENKDLKDLIKKATGTAKKAYSGALSSTFTLNGSDVTSKIVDKSNELVKIGLNAAIGAKTAGIANIAWKESKTREAVVKDEKGNSVYNESVNYRFTLSNFKSNPSATAKINYTSQYGVTAKYFVNDKELTGDTINFVDYLDKNGNATVNVKIKFTGNSSTYGCESIKYSISLNYKDDSIANETYKMYPTVKELGWRYQEFYVVNGNGATTDLIETSVSLCSSTTHKDGCSTLIVNDDCVPTDEVQLKEGYIYDTDDSCLYTGSEKAQNAKLNIKKCIIGGEDNNGNTYKAADLLQNEYCSVYCKEDYTFNFPGDLYVNSGRTITFDTDVKGTKSCYTNEINGREAIIGGINAAACASVNARNTFAGEWCRSHESAGPGMTTCITDFDEEPAPNYNSCKAKKHIDGGCNDKNGNGKYDPGECWDGYDISETDYHDSVKITYKWTYDTYTCGGGRGSTTEYSDPGYTEWTGTDLGDGSGKCRWELTKGSEAVKKELKEKVKSSASCSISSSGGSSGGGVSGGGKNFPGGSPSYSMSCSGSGCVGMGASHELINKFNSCSGWTGTEHSVDKSKVDHDYYLVLNSDALAYGWSMSYNYNPTAYYAYDESYMGFLTGDQDRMLGTIISQDADPEYNVCLGEVTDDFECPSGWVTPSEALATESYFSCTCLECNWSAYLLTRAKYAKQEMNVEAKYIIPTIFYTIFPTGAIVINDDPSVEIEDSKALEHELPVGLNTVGGPHNYVIYFENLGEYYDKKDKMGRIWGAANSTVATVLNDHKCDGAMIYDTTANGDFYDEGVYNCHYNVNSKCPDCPVECDGCLYNTKANFLFRQISPFDINPNDRKLGVNWAYDQFTTAIEMKAFATTEQIKETGEKVYDFTEDDAILKVKMDTRMVAKIKNYNDSQKDNGGFLNNSLKCYNYYNDSDQKEYINILCYSTFLDELTLDDSVKDNLTWKNEHRNDGLSAEKNATDKYRKSVNSETHHTKAQDSGYWTPWAESKVSDWSISTEKGISYEKFINTTKDYYSIGIGPSWK